MLQTVIKTKPKPKPKQNKELPDREIEHLKHTFTTINSYP